MSVTLQVIGKKKSGKTTTMCHFIQQAVKQELEVVAFKNTHHSVSMDVAGTDTYKFSQAGAKQVCMKNGRGLFLHEQRTEGVDPSLAEEIQTFIQPAIEIVLIEGFKEEKYPKLLLLRPQDVVEDFDVTGVIAVASIYPEVIQKEQVVDLSTKEKAQRWFLTWLKQQEVEMDELTHFNQQHRAKMVDISEKRMTKRSATAHCQVVMQPTTLQRIKEGHIDKGDVLAVAQVAAIMAAKKTSEIIPMCHLIALSGVDVLFDDDDNQTLTITVTAKANQATGVEMEALTACQIAALTIYDMCKAMDRTMEITNCRLLEKTGGKSGDHYFGASQ